MYLINAKRRGWAVVLAWTIGLSVFSLGVSAQEYQDFDEIMNTGIDLKSEQSLKISNPSEDTTVTSEYFYITGASDPSKTLLCNGEEVSDRGIYGSFGVYSPLEMGENTFQFQNGGDSVSVTITRTKASSGVATVSTLKKTYPQYDDLAYSGETYKLRCTAPANGTVFAVFDGEKVELRQEVAATTGVEAYYSAEITLPAIGKSEMKNLGSVTYQLSWDGKTSKKESAGEVIIAGKSAQPVVQVSQNAAILYEDGNSDANFISTLSVGAVDKVVDSNSSFYELSMGGWLSKEYAQLLDAGTGYQNKVTNVSYDSDSTGETFILNGTANAAFKAYSNSEKVTIRFYNTTGLTSVPVSDSTLFSSIDVTSENNVVTLDFIKRKTGNLIGYNISYDDVGNTTIFFNPMPKASASEKPLKGINVVIDAGHGGLDSGALGVLFTDGPNEKDITLATSIATKNRLESLGANVTMTVDKTLTNDRKVELTDRVRIAHESKADFFLSLHCNSIAANSNGLQPTGTEIYYYENNSKTLAERMLANITSYTNRKVRNVNYGYYYVTRNPLCASMLIELGFMTNPAEYDNLRNPETIFETANAIGDTLVAYVK